MKNINKNKVFVSTGFFKKLSPDEVMHIFYRNQIFDLEFSGGKYIDLKEIKNLTKFSKQINLRIHNYFPPPKKSFVINLASNDKNILKNSIKQIKKSILLARKFKNKYFSFHAGFRIDPKVNKLGKRFNKYKMTDKTLAEKIFHDNLIKINKFATKNKIKLLIENNVLTKENLNRFGENPLLLTNPKDIINFFKRLPKNIGLLLDTGHLKVSSKTEKFNHTQAIKKLNSIVTGYHLSDNNFIVDSNEAITHKSWFLKSLKKKLNYYTIEVYKKI